MPRGVEVVAGRALNPGATLTGVTINTGNSLTVRSFNDPASAWLDALWTQGATAGAIRIRSAKLHDFVQGIRFVNVAGVSRNLIPDELAQRLFSQDTLTVEVSGGGAETDVAAFLAYYEDAGGLDARVASWDQVLPRIVNILTNEVVVTAPATAGDWSAGTAINATNDLLKANTDYAILGYQTLGAVAAVGIQGSDTSNLRTGGPGTTESIETRDWFLSMGKATGRPYIPIINSANKGATLVSVCNATAAGTTVDLIMAQLSPS